jgi:hypothetical protein
MTFRHQSDDVAVTVRFREDVWSFIEAKMHNKKYNHNKKRQYGRMSTHLPVKSIHTVLDEQLRRLMALEANNCENNL